MKLKNHANFEYFGLTLCLPDWVEWVYCEEWDGDIFINYSSDEPVWSLDREFNRLAVRRRVSTDIQVELGENQRIEGTCVRVVR